MPADPEKAIPADETMDDDDVEEEVEANEDNAVGKIMSKMSQDPRLMAALQGGLSSMVGANSGYIQNLPAPVKRRLKALKKLQFEATNIEAKFYEEIHQLEMKYHKLYEPLYEKRTKITTGGYEPNETECDWPSEDEDDEELADDMKDKAKLESEKKENGEAKQNGDAKDEDVKGVPEFWLTIFKNVEMLADMVQDHDEEPLQALNDITCTFSDSPVMGFKLHFHFGANDYFSNSVLTKEYEMRCKPSEDAPFEFDGPEIYKCKGCDIDWKQGKNLTVKTVTRKQKHKQKGSVRTIKKTVKNDSLFNFFSPPDIPENPEELDEETQELLTSDFEIGHYIRERILPRAVLFFTGEALEDDDYDDEEEEEDEDDDDEDGEEEEEEDPDFDPEKAKKQQECKQQ